MGLLLFFTNKSYKPNIDKLLKDNNTILRAILKVIKLKELYKKL